MQKQLFNIKTKSICKNAQLVFERNSFKNDTYTFAIDNDRKLSVLDSKGEKVPFLLNIESCVDENYSRKLTVAGWQKQIAVKMTLALEGAKLHKVTEYLRVCEKYELFTNPFCDTALLVSYCNILEKWHFQLMDKTLANVRRLDSQTVYGCTDVLFIFDNKKQIQPAFVDQYLQSVGINASWV